MAPSARARQQFAARTELVEVYATVTDDGGRFVTDIGRDEFTVLEDGVPQPLTTFADGEQPVSIALAVDRSWSMANGSLDAARRGGRDLLRELGDQDRVMLVAIGSEVEVPVPLTNDRRASIPPCRRSIPGDRRRCTMPSSPPSTPSSRRQDDARWC